MSTDLYPSLMYYQKSTLVENILRYVHKIQAKSLLDIGAGSLETALPISQSVETYLAIEKDVVSANELRAAKLNVIQGRFPLSINHTFDLVLSSHSIPERSLDSYHPLLSKALELTNPGGCFLIATFKGGMASLEELRLELLDIEPNRSPESEKVISFLKTQGELHIERVSSYVQAKSGETMAEFLSPWISSRREELAGKMPRLLHILSTNYKVKSDLFVFPTEHLFISCTKQADSK